MVCAGMLAMPAAWADGPGHESAWLPLWRWTGGALVVGVAVAALLLAWNLSLRRRVRRRTEQLSNAVAKAEAARDRLDALLEALPDLLFEVDETGRYLDFRARDPAMLVAPPEALIGATLADHFSGEQLTAARRTVDEAVRDGSSSGQLLHLRFGGDERWFELSAARKRTVPGEPVHVVVLSRDITARRQAEAALLRRDREFREFFESGLVGMAITDRHRHWMGSNATLAAMLGYASAELHALTWTELTHPDDRAPSQELYERMVAGEIDSHTFDKRYRRRDGSYVDASVSVRCVRDGDGQAERFYVLVEDVSARKHAERELRRHQERLEELVEERSRELRLARDEAQAASRAKSELLSRMSHELRTPMNAILGFSQLLELDKSLAPNPTRYVGEILRAGQHLLDLINDVLDLAQVEAGRVSLAPGAVPPAQIVDDVLTLMRPLADRRGVRLHASGLALVPPVHADRTRLKQVLVNLVSNAIKYNRANGGEVEVSAEAVPGDAAVVRLTVRDTGPGLEPGKVARLFEPFDRLGAEFGSEEGTGIGLSICRRLVELMHGRIGVDSEPGAGSRFWFELPVSAARPGDHNG